MGRVWDVVCDGGEGEEERGEEEDGGDVHFWRLVVDRGMEGGREFRFDGLRVFFRSCIVEVLSTRWPRNNNA